MEIASEPLDETQLAAVAALHRASLPEGFLSTLPDRFLVRLYRGVQSYPGGVLIAAIDEGEVFGFIAAADDVGKFYRWFLSRNIFQAGWFMLPRLFSPSLWRRSLETLFYPARSVRDPSIDVPAELLTLAVDARVRRQGIAARLYEELLDQFRLRNIARFKIVVGQSNQDASRFYETMGAERIGAMEMHQGTMSWLFVQDARAVISGELPTDAS